MKALSAKHIVLLTFFFVAEHSIRFVDLFEALLCLLVTFVLVRVVFHGQLSEGLLDLVFTGVFVHTQDLVVIFACHYLFSILSKFSAIKQPQNVILSRLAPGWQGQRKTAGSLQVAAGRRI